MYADYPDFGLTAAQRHDAVFAHRYEHPGMDGARGEIWCYSDALAYAPGSTVRLQISSTAARAGIEIARDGAQLRVVLQRSLSGLRWQSTAGALLDRGLWLGNGIRVPGGRGLAVGCVSHHPDGRGPRRLADPHASPVHRQAAPGPAARTAAAGRRHGKLDRLQHLGRLESLPGPHRTESRSILPDRQPGAPVGARLHRPASRCAAGADRGLAAARLSPALSASRVGLCDRSFEQIRLRGLGELRLALHAVGRARRLCGRPGEPARAAFHARAAARVRLRRHGWP